MRSIIVAVLMLAGCGHVPGTECYVGSSTPYTTNDACLGCHDTYQPGVNMHPGPCVQCHIASSTLELHLLAPRQTICLACHTE